ncbi:uncharacterized protein [Rhodnius prolixus]|uniref:uncharacterized protein n=1 Tax=Rhodnius prolixus TaxID=13249 RepID=UPI003D18A556
MTDKEFLDANPLSSVDDKMDEDFIIFLEYASKLAEKGNNVRDFPKFKAWLEKLVFGPASTVVKKRARNIYLSQLLLQLKDDRLSGVFADMPPGGNLIPPMDVFDGANLYSKKTVHDLELEIPLDSNTFQHVSQDGRTYMAAKSLSEGAGMCGYLAVSIGEASKGLWLDSCGRPTKVVENYVPEIPIMSSEEKLTTESGADAQPTKESTGSKLSDILKTRVSERERKNLTAFYQDILKRIECILHQHKDISDPIDIKDPVIQEMMEKIRCETATVGGLMCAPVDIHARTLLMALKRKVACKLEKITNREHLINEIKSSMGEKQDLTMVDLSKNIADPSDCAIWKSVKNYTIPKENIVRLTRFYGDRISETINFLFERQKAIIYEQEKNAHHETLASYRNALVEETRENIEKYFIIRKEWQRVHDVLMEIERIQREVSQYLEANEEIILSGQPQTLHSEIYAQAAIDLQKQIDDSQKMSENLDNEIVEMRRQLHTVKASYKDVYNRMKLTGTQWREQINLLQCEVKKQERKMQQLKILFQTGKDSQQINTMIC